MGTFSQPSSQIDAGMNTPQPSQGKGSTTMSSTSGQPQFGQPNQYPNTIQGGWDNATIGNQAMGQSGKGGKGQGSWQPFNQPWNPPGQ